MIGNAVLAWLGGTAVGIVTAAAAVGTLTPAMALACAGTSALATLLCVWSQS